jgi:hypothetical protein
MSTSRIACGLKTFPYGQNITAVVSAVMTKDRQDAAQKRRAVIRMADSRREAKRAQGSVKTAASGSSQPVPAAKPAAPRSSKPLAGAKTAAAGGTKSPPVEAAKGRELPSPGKRVTDFGMNISVEDYFVGKFFFQAFGPVICCITGSGEGHMVVVPPSVATALPSAEVRARGTAQDSWATFCTSSEILIAAVAKDVAGTMSQRPREASHRLSQ